MRLYTRVFDIIISRFCATAQPAAVKKGIVYIVCVASWLQVCRVAGGCMSIDGTAINYIQHTLRACIYTGATNLYGNLANLCVGDMVYTIYRRIFFSRAHTAYGLIQSRSSFVNMLIPKSFFLLFYLKNLHFTIFKNKKVIILSISFFLYFFTKLIFQNLVSLSVSTATTTTTTMWHNNVIFTG